MTLNELAKQIHVAMSKWWTDVDTGKPIKRNPYELLALVISELSEALEGERKDLMDDKLTHRKMAEVEMADAKIRLLDFSAAAGLDLKSYPTANMPDNKGQSIFMITQVICAAPGSSNKREYSNAVSHAILLIESYCSKFGYDLEGAIVEKMKFNETREDHTHEVRRIAGGKKF